MMLIFDSSSLSIIKHTWLFNFVRQSNEMGISIFVTSIVLFAFILQFRFAPPNKKLNTLNNFTIVVWCFAFSLSLFTCQSTINLIKELVRSFTIQMFACFFFLFFLFSLFCLRLISFAFYRSSWYLACSFYTILAGFKKATFFNLFTSATVESSKCCNSVHWFYSIQSF